MEGFLKKIMDENTNLQIFHIIMEEMLEDNGWCYVADESNDDFSMYEKTLSYQDCKSDYDIVAQMLVSDAKSSLEFCGELGIYEITISGYAGGAYPPYTVRDLESFLCAVRVAEEQLLDAGIPFASEYIFRCDEDGAKAARNRELINQLNILAIIGKAAWS